MIGNISIVVAFIAALITAILFLREAKSSALGPEKGHRWSLYFYHLHTFSLLVTTVYLFYALFSHKFEYYYVYVHSSLDLPLEYLISAFWAGQEGTYILWALVTALAGYLLIRREKEFLPVMMPVIMLAQMFLLLFLMLENPFFHLGQVPPDGMGLNPLLMDPWMVIHPPIVFIGYALLIFPFAFAVAALWKKDFQRGFLRALPWAVAGWFFLGTGILIGGAWAYRVLGWGGYWGWDPVENASLVPWLTAAALVHGLIAQRQKKLYVKSNLVLAVVTYGLIIFATYLTRSGAMADFSVHAFAETTLAHFILSFFLVFTLGGLLLFAFRYQALPRAADEPGYFSKKSSFTTTMVVLSLIASLIMLGTLSPILTGLFGQAASVDENFYLQTTAPLFFVLFLSLTLCPLLSWKKEGWPALLKRLKGPLYVLVPCLVAGYFLGIKSVLGLVLLSSFVLALAVNVVYFQKTWRKNILHSGGYLAHIGLAVLFIGIVASTGYTESEMVVLPKGETVAALGLELSYQGLVTEGVNNYPEVMIIDGEKSYQARPNLYMAGDKLMRTPFIKRSVVRDLYLSPLEVQVAQDKESLNLGVGETALYNGYEILFKGFQMDSHQEADLVEVGALLEVTKDGEVAQYMPAIRFAGAERVSPPVDFIEGSTITLEELDADNRLVRLSIAQEGAEASEVFMAELKIKPLISLLILGAVLLSAGTFLATLRRFKERH